mgnify:CR=1 FL=1
MPQTIRLHRVLRTTPEKAYRAFLEPDALARWIPPYGFICKVHSLDAKVGGNAARWINHACQPNCEADDVNGRIFIKALRAIKPGEELFYDYGLILDDRYTAKVKKQFECRCGTRKCRGTMLAPKR